MSFWRELGEREIWIAHFRAGSHSGVSKNERVRCPSTEPKLPDSASSLLSLSLFLKSLSVTCCEIPRRRQEEKNQEADICFLCAVQPTSQMKDCMFWWLFFLKENFYLLSPCVCCLKIFFPTWKMSSLLSLTSSQWQGEALKSNCRRAFPPTLLPMVSMVKKPVGIHEPWWPIGIGQ